MHDTIMGFPSYPSMYSGRAISHKGIEELEKGASLEDVAAAFQKAEQEGDESRLVAFAYVPILCMLHRDWTNIQIEELELAS